jgi:hypothetical protein
MNFVRYGEGPGFRSGSITTLLDWLKPKGEGHLTRINEILRERMAAELGRGQPGKLS